MLEGVGERLKDARQRAGLTQHKVSLALDVTIGTVQAWEYERANLTLRRAAELADLYAVTTDWLAYGGDRPLLEDPRIAQIRELVE